VLAGSIVPSATLGHSLAEELGVPTDSKSPCSSCSDESCKGREAKFVRKEPPKLDKDGFPELSLLSQSPELYYDISDACVEFDYKSILTTCEKGCHKCCSARYCCMTLDEARWVYSAHTDLCNQLLPEFRRLHKLKGKELDGEKCPFLLHGECSIYSVRPIYCRTVVSIHPPEECTIEGPTNPSVDRLTRLWRSIIIAYASVRSDTFGFGRVSGMMLNQMCPEETEGAVIRVKTETLDVDDEPGTAH
jgi:Fe-S-cluster containining protein